MPSRECAARNKSGLGHEKAADAGPSLFAVGVGQLPFTRTSCVVLGAVNSEEPT